MSTQTESDPEEANLDQTSNENCRYRCPYCSAVYQNEITARTHITRSEDASHRNYNGYMPEVEVELINDDNKVIRTISRRPEDIDPQNLTIDDLPAEKPEEHKHILLVAARHPDESNYETLTKTAKKVLEYQDLETRSYSSIRRIIRSFYRPTEVKQDSGSSTEKEETLSDCTALQQAIIITRLVQQTKSKSTLADMVGCAPSYPSQVLADKKSVINRLKSEIDDQKNPVDVICDNLDDDSIIELSDRDLLEGIDITLDGQNSDEAQEMWGLSIENDDVAEDDQPNDPSVNGENGMQPDVETSPRTIERQSTSNKSIPRKEVEELRQKIVFLRRVLERANDPENNDLGRIIALAEQVEQVLEGILEGE